MAAGLSQSILESEMTEQSHPFRKPRRKPRLWLTLGNIEYAAGRGGFVHVGDLVCVNGDLYKVYRHHMTDENSHRFICLNSEADEFRIFMKFEVLSDRQI